MEKLEQNNGKKGLVGVAREAYYRYFEHSLIYGTDPVKEYSVVYDIEEMIWSKGEYVKAVYGMTQERVPLWRVLINKKASALTVGLNDDFFMLGNLVAFCQIHSTQFNREGATQKERRWAMTWFVQHVFNWNRIRGIELHMVTKTGMHWSEYLVDRAWGYGIVDVYTKQAGYFEAFFSMTDIFPGNEVGRRALVHSKARFAFHTSITLIREAMTLNDGLVTHKLVDEFNSAMIPAHISQKIIDDKKLHREAGIRVLTNYSAEDYYLNTIQLTKKNRAVMRVMDILDKFKPRSVRELAEYLDESEYVTHKMLSMMGPDALLQLKNGWLVELAQTCESKRELEQKSGLSRTTLARRANRDKELDRLWREL